MSAAACDATLGVIVRVSVRVRLRYWAANSGRAYDSKNPHAEHRKVPTGTHLSFGISALPNQDFCGAPSTGLAAALAILVLLPLTGTAGGQGANTEPVFETLFYTHDGLRLEAYLYTPSGGGPFPMVVYNHGSARLARSVSNGRLRS